MTTVARSLTCRFIVIGHKSTESISEQKGGRSHSRRPVSISAVGCKGKAGSVTAVIRFSHGAFLGQTGDLAAQGGARWQKTSGQGWPSQTKHPRGKRAGLGVRAAQGTETMDAAVNEEMEGAGGSAWRARNAEYTFAVLGDLHLEPAQMDVFHHARSQIVQELTGPDGQLVPNAHIFQLGDVGGYKFQPGSRKCFERAVEFLDGFNTPRHSVTGNHDLEGDEFERDAENLAAWEEMFGQRHFWAEDFGSVLCIGLSTVQFRDASDSNHEVVIGEQQIRWFRDTLAQNKDRATFVFSHAPPMGAGLTSLQEVHVRNRCAWLNHSKERPEEFLEITRENPQIKMWFSGHYHLSHDYEGSVSQVGACLFVQTGVMGLCHRDGRRHSRVVKGGEDGFQLYTLDHGSGSLRLDVVHSYSHEGRIPPQRLWCSNLSFLTSCPGGGAFSPRMPTDTPLDPDQTPPNIPSSVRWWHVGDTILALNANQLVQYDVATRAPLGIAVDAVNGREIRLVASPQGQVESIELHPTPASEALAGREGLKGKTAFQRVPRNEAGGFWQIFQVNKWLLKREKAAAEAALAALAGPLPRPF